MQLIDSFGRQHNNLRISVTDRCNLRCSYCMPEEVVFMDRAELLTFEEIAHFVRVAVPLGIDKVRLTGGEPLMRRDIPKLVALIAAIPGIKDIGLTTNGILLTEQAQALYDAGLRRINISLDTLDPRASASWPGATGWTGCWPVSTPPSRPGSTRSRSTRSASAASPNMR